MVGGVCVLHSGLRVNGLCGESAADEEDGVVREPRGGLSACLRRSGKRGMRRGRMIQGSEGFLGDDFGGVPMSQAKARAGRGADASSRRIQDGVQASHDLTIRAVRGCGRGDRGVRSASFRVRTADSRPGGSRGGMERARRSRRAKRGPGVGSGGLRRSSNRSGGRARSPWAGRAAGSG